jgi:hypothetical protein
MPASDNLNQAQFDKKFKDIAVNEVARKKLGEHQGSFGDLEPRATEIATSCNHCGKDAEVNALYHPGSNVMHYRCPSCHKTDTASNWHDFGTNGRMRDAFTGEHFGPAKLDEHLSPPNPNLEPAPSWKRVTSKAWARDGEPEEEEDLSLSKSHTSHTPKLSEDRNSISCADCGKLLHTYK